METALHTAKTWASEALRSLNTLCELVLRAMRDDPARWSAHDSIVGWTDMSQPARNTAVPASRD